MAQDRLDGTLIALRDREDLGHRPFQVRCSAGIPPEHIVPHRLEDLLTGDRHRFFFLQTSQPLLSLVVLIPDTHDFLRETRSGASGLRQSRFELSAPLDTGREHRRGQLQLRIGLEPLLFHALDPPAELRRASPIAGQPIIRIGGGDRLIHDGFAGSIERGLVVALAPHAFGQHCLGLRGDAGAERELMSQLLEANTESGEVIGRLLLF